MEGYRRNNLNNDGTNRNKRKLSRAALAAVAFLGTMPPLAALAEVGQLQQVQERNEAFDANKEADTFLDRISNEQPWGQELKEISNFDVKILHMFMNFAQALDQKIPFYSQQGLRSILGPPSFTAQAAARKYIARKLHDRLERSTNNPGLQTLNSLLSGENFLTQRPDFRGKDW